MIKETIIAPIEKDLLNSELSLEKRLCQCQRSGNEVYSVNYENAPNVCREIGRLREITFRSAGGGTGKALDLDEFDLMKNPCNQLIVWNPREKCILGGYRYKLGKEMDRDEEGNPKIAMSHLFRFSKTFLKDYLPYSIELGRAFVFDAYQATRTQSKSFWTLFDIWQGLYVLIQKYLDMKYFFGKVTLYPSFPSKGLDLILTYFDIYFQDKEGLMLPFTPYKYAVRKDIFKGKDFQKDYKTLEKELHKLGCSVPLMINTYIKTSPKLKSFGTAINYEFGNTYEMGILIGFKEISEKRIKVFGEEGIKKTP